MDMDFFENEYERLTPSERKVFRTILRYAGGIECTLKQERISKLADCHVTTVKTAYRKLQEMDIIAVIGHGEILLNPFKCEPIKRFEGDVKNLQKQYDEASAPFRKRQQERIELKKAIAKPFARQEISSLTSISKNLPCTWCNDGFNGVSRCVECQGTGRAS